MPTNREKRSEIPSPDPTKFREAIEAFRRRDPITDDQLDVLTEVERERAFWVAGVSEADVVQQVFDEIDRAIRDGTTLDEFKDAVGDSLADAWGAEDAFRVETVFRTNVMGAYSAGRHEMMTAPVVLEARPFWRCDRMHGGSHKHEEPDHICARMDGMIRPADDPIWQTHHCPFHHCCGCIVTPLSREQAADEGVSVTPDDLPDPDEGFGKMPSVTGDNWTPDLSTYAKPIAAILRDKLAL